MRIALFALLFILSNIASATIGWFAALPPPRDTERYVIMERSAAMDAASANFTKEQLAWAPGSIIRNGCLFAQEAIKFNYRDHRIGFDPCHSERRDIKLSEDFRDISATMAATVDGKPASFDVSLQHNPPSTGEHGFRLLALRQR